MNINLSFFKKSFITGAGLAIAFGSAMALFASAGATQNNQTTTHGIGYELTAKSNLTKITPSNNPKPCPNPHGLTCRVCAPHKPNFCGYCPSNSGVGIPCRIFSGNQGSGGLITPQNMDNNSSSSSGSYITPAPDHVGPPTGIDSGSPTGDNPTTTPSTTPPGTYCPSNPRMGIACVAPGDQTSGGGICTPRMPCGAAL